MKSILWIGVDVSKNRFHAACRNRSEPQALIASLARIDHRFGNEGDFGRPERFSESFSIDPVQVE